MATRKKKTGKKTARRKRPARKRKPARSWPRRHPWLSAFALASVTFALWVLSLDLRITRTFETRRWDLPARVHAQPLELFVGKALSADQLEQHLRQLGYASAANVSRSGEYRRRAGAFDVFRRDALFWDGNEAEIRLRVQVSAGRVTGLSGSRGAIVVARLDPLVIGSIFAAHGEDRQVLAPEQIPPLLTDTLRLVEDRRFDSHFGIDLVAIMRAALANIRAGGIRQGGSTLTQQLVKSYFLTNERSFRRKFREAVMAMLLEARYSKDEILTAYVNEIYLGQDGARAVHGFGLASQYYFARPLAELDEAQIAMLVAIVRGPSYYQPSRFSERVRERRDRILNMMAEASTIDAATRDRALARPIAVAGRLDGTASYFPAFVDVVRRQLARDYTSDDLQQQGLNVFTTLDPLAQVRAQQHLSGHLTRLAAADNAHASLQGAVVLVEPRTGEVLALIGGRDRVSNGFNRAVDARRQIGSLVKPVVFLAALQSGEWHMASLIDDAPLSMAQEDGKLWEPQNFSATFDGEMPLVRALAESVNVATVRLGLQVGIKRIAQTLARLGGPQLEQPFASLLLGAVEMTPIDVANLYTSLASDGLRPPLRAVREVVTNDLATVQRYPLTIDTVAGSDALFQLNTAMRQVMVRGTGRSAQLPQGLVTVGKSGTTNDFRDAWFAGYSADRLAVVWVGNDDNSPTGLTGSRGALPVWSALMRDVARDGVRFSPPQQSTLAYIDYLTGTSSRERCDEAVEVGLPVDVRLARGTRCNGPGAAEKALQWLKDTF